MIKTILIEDELNARNALKKMLQIIATDIDIIAETGFVNEALSLINALNPDLIFLDIKLEDGTGFDIIEKIKDPNFKIIFTTAYNEYAIKAFKVSALDYLLKPIDPFELKTALQKTTTIIDAEKEYKTLLSVFKNNENEADKKIVLKTSNNRYIVYLKDIIRLEADGAYTLFVTEKQNIIISKNLKYYQDLLDEKMFIRCHQSHLVNSKQIISIYKNGQLLLSNKELIPISVRKKSEIIKKLQEVK
ncbi:MAG TPA: response regulator transcription factor [Saprospiraceae bacterium]|nr:response regulator transcription factor [Saprospiraceae bacterium]